MKQIYGAALISLFILLLLSNTQARILPLHQDEHPRTKQIQQGDDFSSLMGLEECNDKDEWCEKRRMVAEAHLDYIYTQHQHP